MVFWKELTQLSAGKLFYRLIIDSGQEGFLWVLELSVWQVRTYLSTQPTNLIFLRQIRKVYLFAFFFLSASKMLPRKRNSRKSIFLLNHMDAWHVYYVFTTSPELKFKDHTNALAQKEGWWPGFSCALIPAMISSKLSHLDKDTYTSHLIQKQGTGSP